MLTQGTESANILVCLIKDLTGNVLSDGSRTDDTLLKSGSVLIVYEVVMVFILETHSVSNSNATG